jgi:molecular chaperone HscB
MLDDLHQRLRTEVRAEYGLLQQALDANALERAGELVRQLMFQEKLLQEVDDALALAEG